MLMSTIGSPKPRQPLALLVMCFEINTFLITSKEKFTKLLFRLFCFMGVRFGEVWRLREGLDGTGPFLVRGVLVNRKAPPSKIQTSSCKRAACGLAVPPYHRTKPIYLPSNATDASRGRPLAYFETLARPSTLRASRLRIPGRKAAPPKPCLRPKEY